MRKIYVGHRTIVIAVLLSCTIGTCSSWSLFRSDDGIHGIKKQSPNSFSSLSSNEQYTRNNQTYCKIISEFECNDGSCIETSRICDGVRDCEDGSDETEQICIHIRCPTFMARCEYGACVAPSAVCDGVTDCADGSDEVGCSVARSINESDSENRIRLKRQEACDFRCKSNECIEVQYLCDGNADCADGSDETTAECSGVRCPSFLFQCKYGACIPKNQFCDGEKNCADNSDEQGPNCNNPKVSGSTCTNFQFRCNDGTCIDRLETCDGIKNCPDGSDETEDACTGLVCPNYLYRCAYGACVAKTARCNGVDDCADGSDELGCGFVPPTPTVTQPTPTPPAVTPSSGCLLPAHLPTGRYKYTAGGTYKENTVAGSATSITLTCNPGYIETEIANFYCLNNRWIPEISKGNCLRICPNIKSTETYDVECTYKGQAVTCENPIEGTRANLKCKPYYDFFGTRQIPSCQDGSWDPYPVPCEPVCGQKIVNAETLVVGGSDAVEGEYPWIVAVYNTSFGQSKHICGGSIISRQYVLSAAHCFADSKGVSYDSTYFTIVAGKHFRDLSKSEHGSQVRQIKRLYIHEDYKGRLQKFRDDIALVEVEKFEMSANVQTVCIDWDSTLEEQDLREENKAVVAGWGFTTEGSTVAEVLKKLIVPFRSTETCKKYMDPDFFQQYYASDKICAGYKDEGTSVCSGDSGGGLYFRSKPTTFYVRGVVSLAPRSLTGCNSNHYALYTKVSKFLSWVDGITLRRL